MDPQESNRSGGVSARTMWALILIVVAVGVVVAWYLIAGFSDPDPYAEIEFDSFSEDSTATVGFAGQFPAGGGGLAAPTGITADGTSIYVSVRDDSMIAEFTYRGGLESTVAIPPAEGFSVATPIDLAMLGDGRLVVVDSAATRVLFLDPDTGDIDVFGETVLGQPTAVAADGDTIIVADAQDARLEAFSYDGGHIGAIGEDLEPALTFIGGMHIVDGSVYVSDSNASRVLALDISTGQQLAIVQQKLGLPKGIATDNAGRLFVADTFAATVPIFDPTGTTRVDTVGEDTTEGLDNGGLMSAPQDILWDSGGLHIYVTDVDQGRIKVYNVRTEIP